MTRSKWALLGLSALALLATSALIAGSAQGDPRNKTHTPATDHEFTCLQADHVSHQHCTGDGTEAKMHRFHDGAQQTDHQFDSGVGTLKCGTTSFSVRTDPDGTSQTAPTDPTYANCTVAGTFTAHVNMNGCHYEFDVEKTIQTGTPPPGYEVAEGQGSAELVCPNGPVTINVTRVLGGTKCHIEVPAQKTITPIYFRNSTADPTDVTVEADTATTIIITKGSVTDCGVLAGENHAQYTGNTTVRATNAVEQFIDARFD